LNIFNNKGRVNSTKGKILLFLIFLLIALAGILLVLFLRQSKDLAQIKKDEKVIHELVDEETKDKDQLKKLNKKYQDMIGWIKIPDTEFSYPVMQTGTKGHREEVPEFYLYSNVNGEYSFMGTPFLDSRCSMDSDNLIIYGHNINGAKMFGYLQGYRQSTFCKDHPAMYFTKCGSTKEKYEVVSVLITDIYSHMYSFVDIYTDEIYKEDIEKLLSESIYETEIS